MFEVPYGQDPYNAIGEYIRNHITVIEDIIAVIGIDGSITNTLFMVDMDVPGYFIWNTDWYEGEKNVALIDFFPVSEATKPITQPERKKGKWEIYIISMLDGEGCRCSECGFEGAPYWDYCPNCGSPMEGVVYDV